MKRRLEGKKVKVQTENGARVGTVIKQFTEYFGMNSGKNLVTIILEGSDLNNYENEITCRASTVKIVD